jgi:hypothetical protein
MQRALFINWIVFWGVTMSSVEVYPSAQMPRVQFFDDSALSIVMSANTASEVTSQLSCWGKSIELRTERGNIDRSVGHFYCLRTAFGELCRVANHRLSHGKMYVSLTSAEQTYNEEGRPVTHVTSFRLTAHRDGSKLLVTLAA